jgi:hypothetical protein
MMIHQGPLLCFTSFHATGKLLLTLFGFESLLSFVNAVRGAFKPPRLLGRSIYLLISAHQNGIISVRCKTCERGGKADAPGSGPGGCIPVEVQLLSLAPRTSELRE